jgi:hypothetical protein
MIRTQNSSGPKLIAAVLVVYAVIFVSGCAHKDARPDPQPVVHTGPKVAVAPMENISNYVSATDIIRDAFVEGLGERGYAVMPVLESDRILREELGISYGGQLPVTTPQEVCAVLGVEAVFFGEVEEFGKTTTGFYNSSYVAASFKLYGKDGSVLWEGKDRHDRKDVARGDNAGLLAEAVVRGLGNLVANPLTPIGKRVGKNIARQTSGDLLPEEARKRNKPVSLDKPNSSDEMKNSPEPELSIEKSKLSEAPKTPEASKLPDEPKP